uniref:Photoconvertible water-soluble chlorophyll-binding protein 2 n=1 Tax=Chenopodium ficifolium TaxID=887860 RepID=A0A0B6VHY4_9CARY|nr:photoconvertible water-soluble chlorophyll-binding protein 2 [Chenopodium ficifolium]
MSPKPTTTSFALLAITLALALSSAHAHCPASTIPDILKYYGLPPSIFPGNGVSFSCGPVNQNSIRLNINLRGKCTVVNELGAIQNVLKCSEKISAVLSHDKLSEVKGVTVQLYVKLLPWLDAAPFGPLMTITGAEASYAPFNLKLFMFISDKGNSPAFPYLLFPNQAPKCANLALYDTFVANTNPEDIPFNPLLVA